LFRVNKKKRRRTRRNRFIKFPTPVQIAKTALDREKKQEEEEPIDS